MKLIHALLLIHTVIAHITLSPAVRPVSGADLWMGEPVRPLHWAARHGLLTLPLAWLFLEDRFEQDSGGRMPMHEAARTGSTATAKLIIRAYGPVDPLDYNGKRPLYYAICGGHTEIVRALLNAKASRRDSSLLHLAAARGHASVISVLLEFGWSIKTRHKGKTPLHYAVEGTHPDVVNALLRAGANPYSTVDAQYKNEKRDPKNAIDIAAERKDEDSLAHMALAGAVIPRPTLLQLPSKARARIEHCMDVYERAIFEFPNLPRDIEKLIRGR